MHRIGSKVKSFGVNLPRIEGILLMQLPPKHYTKKVIILDENSSPAARAERLRRIRNMANLNRQQMCAGDEFNINTYKGWEIARYGGLPTDGAERVIQRVAREGVICTAAWLLHGTGQGPYVIPTGTNTSALKIAEPSPAIIYSQDALINNELKLFSQQYQESIHYQINDDGLAPFYLPGDYVAGVKRYGQDIASLIGKSCIVQTGNGEIFTRQLRASNTAGAFHLMCTNLNTTLPLPVVYDVALFCAAAIIRHYRKSS